MSRVMQQPTQRSRPIDDGAMLVIAMAESGTGERWLEIMREKLQEVGFTENRRATSREVVEYLDTHCPFKGPHSAVEKARSFAMHGYYLGPEETPKPLTIEQKMMQGFQPTEAVIPSGDQLANADQQVAKMKAEAEERKRIAAADAAKKEEEERKAGQAKADAAAQAKLAELKEQEAAEAERLRIEAAAKAEREAAELASQGKGDGKGDGKSDDKGGGHKKK